MIQFFVPGRTIPQGSVRAFIRSDRAVVVSKTKNLSQWRDSIAHAAREACPEPYPDAVKVDLKFYRNKPKRSPRSVTMAVARPDLDKLIRAVLDGLTGPAFHDDAQVVEIHATKSFGVEGVQITIESATNHEAEPERSLLAT